MRITAFMVGFIALVMALFVLMLGGPKLVSDMAYIGVLASLGLLAIDSWVSKQHAKP